MGRFFTNFVGSVVRRRILRVLGSMGLGGRIGRSFGEGM